MPIRSRENLYRGVNAHLHSHLQNQPEGWQTFHSDHIADLRRAIDRVLPAGYYSLAEQSLQLREIDLWSGAEIVSRSVQDIAVYRQKEAPPLIVNPPEAAPADATILVADTFPQEEYLMSVVISWVDTKGDLQPITRIELLSPANKPPGSHAPTYVSKRMDTLKHGINLVEIDYLHERRSPLRILPDYTRQESGSVPYTILVNNPHPTPEAGPTHIYRFRVDDPIPTIAIPLKNDEGIALNLNIVYQTTFEQNRYYGDYAVDYEQLPANFPAYDPNDQERIRARMQAAAQAIRSSESAGDS